MADKTETDKAERKQLLQKLLVSARTLKVAPVRDSAARKKVKGMMTLIRKAKGPKKHKNKTEEVKKQAEELYAKYLATFTKEAAARPGQQEQQLEQPQFRLRGTSFLFTYSLCCRVFAVQRLQLDRIQGTRASAIYEGHAGRQNSTSPLQKFLEKVYSIAAGSDVQVSRIAEVLQCVFPFGNGAPVQCFPGFIAKWAVQLFNLVPL